MAHKEQVRGPWLSHRVVGVPYTVAWASSMEEQQEGGRTGAGRDARLFSQASSK